MLPRIGPFPRPVRSPARTTPPRDGVPVALYDGHCKICTSQALQLRETAGGRLAVQDFQAKGVLDAFPGLTHEACMKALHVVDREGRVAVGAEGVVWALGLGRPLLGALARGYYVPGVRTLCDLAYHFVARYRYQLFGKVGGKRTVVCDEDACAVHFT